jgi:hypothetical protein
MADEVIEEIDKLGVSRSFQPVNALLQHISNLFLVHSPDGARFLEQDLRD